MIDASKLGHLVSSTALVSDHFDARVNENLVKIATPKVQKKKKKKSWRVIFQVPRVS